ncbi:MAG TPA: choice-of-anchor tandem repeat GloVer-containing protein [Rhizomicrobium sp.]|jgi:uncharacterized repeat protein (TIGR03803 family)|nr:choice-of-anchor tandem repeat GloVer-containing protein [Rhizomicrobium sp.]
MLSFIAVWSKSAQVCAITLILFGLLADAHAESDVVLYAFQGARDGSAPEGGLIPDAAGNLYGTTVSGGRHYKRGGYGTVFKLAPDGTETVLYAFRGYSRGDGQEPLGGLIADQAGNLFGTTSSGGSNCPQSDGCGTVFRISPDGRETILHAFAGGTDGWAPYGDLVADRHGNLYGTTYMGGGSGCFEGEGCGTVFRITLDGKEEVIYAFAGESYGAYPVAGLLFDKAKNLYGVTSEGGNGAGTVFRIAADGSESVLYAFEGGSDGQAPDGKLIADKEGNLYGTTADGGTSGLGTVYKLAGDGSETVLYSFSGGSDGDEPLGRLLFDSSGNLYGTTLVGGGNGCVFGAGCGTVFKLAPNGAETLLHVFKGGNDGALPYADLIKKADGLYGTASSGGPYCCGTVFKLQIR